MTMKVAGEREVGVQEVLVRALAEVSILSLKEIRQGVRISENKVADLVADIDTPSGRWRLIVEVRTRGEPRMLRVAAGELAALTEQQPNAYGIVVAPYISDRGREACRQQGVGVADLVGNVYLCFNGVLLDRRGNPNPYPLRKRVKSLFAPRSTRGLRVLLEAPERRWFVRDLAAEAQLSIGQVSAVKRVLRDQDLACEQGRAFWLARPEELLREWSRAYNFSANETRLYYSLSAVREIEEQLAAVCTEKGIRYGLALFSGASRVAPFVPYNRAFAYVGERLDEVAEVLGLRGVPSGANVSLLRPYDSGVFYGLQEGEGLKVVSDIQLYLDLRSYRGRGEEAAEFLYETRIRPRWNL